MLSMWHNLEYEMYIYNYNNKIKHVIYITLYVIYLIDNLALHQLNQIFWFCKVFI